MLLRKPRLTSWIVGAYCTSHSQVQWLAERWGQKPNRRLLAIKLPLWRRRKCIINSRYLVELQLLQHGVLEQRFFCYYESHAELLAEKVWPSSEGRTSIVLDHRSRTLAQINMRFKYK